MSKMKRAIVINGLSRGGTNIVWNILQSNENIVGCRKETHEIFWKYPIRGLARIHRFLFCLIYRISPYFLKKYIHAFIKNKYELKKMSSLFHPIKKYKNPTEIYTKKEMEDSIVCIKSTDRDIKLASIIDDAYDNTINIFLVRDPYAVIYGWFRRGKSIKQAAAFYNWHIKKIQQLFSKNQQNSVLVRFDSVIKDPLKFQHLILNKFGIDNFSSEYLRLKFNKKVLNENHEHLDLSINNPGGWFKITDYDKFVKKDIDEIQKKFLDPNQNSLINKLCSDSIEYYRNLPSLGE